MNEAIESYITALKMEGKIVFTDDDYYRIMAPGRLNPTGLNKIIISNDEVIFYIRNYYFQSLKYTLPLFYEDYDVIEVPDAKTYRVHIKGTPKQRIGFLLNFIEFAGEVRMGTMAYNA